MSAYNTIETCILCPACQHKLHFNIQFKYGEVWQHHYLIGDVIKWGKNEVGYRGVNQVWVDGVSDACKYCGWFGDFIIELHNDKIIDIRISGKKNPFKELGLNFIIIDE